MKIKINHKIIAISLVIIFFIVLLIKLSGTIKLKNEIVEQNSILNDKNNELLDLTKKITSKKEEKNKNFTPEYYINSIMSYCLLENIQIETKVNKSLYKDMIQLELKFPLFQDQYKFKEFLVSLSFLGYIEKVTPNIVLLNVKSLSIKEAKSIIEKQ